MPRTRASRRRISASALFPERQIIVRSEGRVAYVKVSTATQIVASLAMAVGAAAVTLGVGFNALAPASVAQAPAPRTEFAFAAPASVLATNMVLPPTSPVAPPAPPAPAASVRPAVATPSPPSGNDNSKSAILAELDRARVALAEVSAERDQINQSRNQLAHDMNDLQSKLSNVVETQKRYLDRTNDRGAPDISAVEKALRGAGVKIEKVVPELSPESATGGPLIPLPRLRHDAQSRDVTTAALIADLGDIEQRYTILAAFSQALDRLPIGHPTTDAGISSGFGPRLDPFTGQPAYHEGIDFRAPANAPVAATAAGVVTVAGSQGPYGNMVEIDHGHGIKTRYAHLRQILVHKGDMVAIRQTIGTVGSTGRSEGTHLHYEVRYNDEPIDPKKFIEANRHVHKLDQKDASKRRS